MAQNPQPEDARLAKISSCFKLCQNFPIKGVNFINILPVLRNPELFTLLMDTCVDRIRQKFPGPIDVIVGLEARGFIFGPSLAERLKCGFAPIRKPGKLPGKITSVRYKKEYGEDVFEIEEDAIQQGQRVLIFDDVLATGGSLAAAAELVQKKEGILVGSFVIMELEYLGGRKHLSGMCESLFVQSS